MISVSPKLNKGYQRHLKKKKERKLQGSLWENKNIGPYSIIDELVLIMFFRDMKAQLPTERRTKAAYVSPRGS